MSRPASALALFLATLPAGSLPRPIDITGVNHIGSGHRQALRQEPLTGREADPRPNPEEALIQAEEEAEQAALMDRVRNAVQALPNGPLGTADYQMRDVVTLVYFEGLSRREVAARLSMALTTVGERERRALQTLRAALARSNP